MRKIPQLGEVRTGSFSTLFFTGSLTEYTNNTKQIFLYFIKQFISIGICSNLKATDSNICKKKFDGLIRILRILTKIVIFRHTLIGIKLNKCDNGLPQVFTSLLSKSVLNFVIKEMKGFCGSCGMENEGYRLNTYPWFVAIKEKVNAGTHVYHSGIVFDNFDINVK